MTSVLVSKLHPECGVKIDASTVNGDDASNPLYYNDNRISFEEYSELTDAQKEGVSIMVTDGWIDGYGMYRGNCYRINYSCNYGQMMFLKINYAY